MITYFLNQEEKGKYFHIKMDEMSKQIFQNRKIQMDPRLYEYVLSTLLEIREQLIKTLTFVTLQHLKISNTLKHVKQSLKVKVQLDLENSFGMISKLENS